MPSFDVVCKPNMVEVRNAIDQANKEIANRFDFKGSDARFEQKEFELTAYGDFNCPFSALASARLEELERRGVASGEWRAVEHDTRIPPAGLDVSGDVADMLTSELDRIRDLLAPGEPDRLRLPVRQVSTALATRRYAGTPAGSRPAVRR